MRVDTEHRYSVRDDEILGGAPIITPVSPVESPAGAELRGPDVELDLREEVCPYTFLKAKLALEDMAPGQVLRVVLSNEVSVRDVPRGLAGAGHAVLAVEPGPAGLWAVVVRRR